MRIYLASSWRNSYQPVLLANLRSWGHDVYDFKNPVPGNNGFSWKSCASDEQLKSPTKFRDEVLTSDVARDGFAHDMRALHNADATVLLLPCGRSAHLELGYAVGRGQRTIVYCETPLGEPELMYLMCSAIVSTNVELRASLENLVGEEFPRSTYDWPNWNPYEETVK